MSQDPRLRDSLFGPDGTRPADRPGERPRPRNRAAAEEAHRARASERVRRRRRSCLAMFLAFVVFVVAIGVAIKAISGGLPSFGGSKSSGGDFSGDGSGSAEVTVSAGDSGYAIGQALQKAGVVKSASTFAQVAGGNPDFAKVQPGTYKLRTQMSSSAAVALLLDPASKVAGGVTVPEGLWTSEIFKILAAKTGTPEADYSKVSVSSLGLPAAAGGSLEGYLWPLTYDFPKGTSAQQQLRTMVQTGIKQRSSLGISDSDLKKVVTIASIVQAEAGNNADMPKVARVVDNRMQPDNSATNGYLQMDSTIHFAQKKRGKLAVSTAETKYPSPYNTYLHKGLPPGPINSPGLAALKAAVSPASGSWLYFVTVNPATGETLFASTLAEHQANEKKYQQWCSDHPGKC